MHKCMHLHIMHFGKSSVHIHLVGCCFRWEQMSRASLSPINENIALLITIECMVNAKMHLHTMHFGNYWGRIHLVVIFDGKICLVHTFHP